MLNVPPETLMEEPGVVDQPTKSVSAAVTVPPEMLSVPVSGPLKFNPAPKPRYPVLMVPPVTFSVPLPGFARLQLLPHESYPMSKPSVHPPPV